jgi:hypothetical protein
LAQAARIRQTGDDISLRHDGAIKPPLPIPGMKSGVEPPLMRKKREDHQSSDHCEHASHSAKLQEHQDQDRDQHERHGSTFLRWTRRTGAKVEVGVLLQTGMQER